MLDALLKMGREVAEKVRGGLKEAKVVRRRPEVLPECACGMKWAQGPGRQRL